MDKDEFITVVQDGDLIYYYTGFVADDAFVALIGNEKYLFVDGRYIESAKKLKGVNVIRMTKGSDFYDFIKNSKVKKTGIYPEYTTYALAKNLIDCGAEIVNASEKIISDTEIKSEHELALIKKSCEICEKSFYEVINDLKTGVTEREIAAKLEYYFKKNGASGTSFDTIIAFGAGGSVPHYLTGDNVLEENMPVLMDFGCKYKGYCSDMTRSFYYGNPPSEYVRVHNAVREAKEKAFENIREGMTGAEADAVSRNVLKGYGLDEYFVHSLGHGVGVKIHEYPRLSPSGKRVLKNGAVFSIEPGVYFEGKFGIRNEDTAYLKDGKAVSFFGKDLIGTSISPKL